MANTPSVTISAQFSEQLLRDLIDDGVELRHVMDVISQYFRVDFIRNNGRWHMQHGAQSVLAGMIIDGEWMTPHVMIADLFKMKAVSDE